jgi:hypothetical protein
MENLKWKMEKGAFLVRGKFRPPSLRGTYIANSPYR